MPKEPFPEPIANTWSEPINGLSGRLRVEFEDLKPGLRHAIFIELRNCSLNSVTLTNQPQASAELFDSAGGPVATSGTSSDGPMPIPEWIVIPRDAYTGFRIDMQTAGLPTREHGVALIAVGGKNWEVAAGKYVLRVALIFQHREDGPQNQWVGELDPPPVEIVVTPQMLAAKAGCGE